MTEVEVGVVGEVDDGGPVGDGPVVDGEGPGGVQGVGGGDVERSGEAHVAVGAVQGEPEDGGGVGTVPGGLPDLGVEAVRAPVEGVAPVVGGDVVRGPVEGEAAVGDAVGVPADDGPEVRVLVGVVVERGQRADDRAGAALGVRHGEAVQDTAVGEDLGPDAGAGVEGPEVDLALPVGAAERFAVHGGHGGSSGGAEGGPPGPVARLPLAGRQRSERACQASPGRRQFDDRP